MARRGSRWAADGGVTVRSATVARRLAPMWTLKADLVALLSTIAAMANSGSKGNTTRAKPKKGGRLRPMAPDSPNRIPEGEILVIFGKRPKHSKK
jgi:cobalamin biosynthesis protein CbiG